MRNYMFFAKQPNLSNIYLLGQDIFTFSCFLLPLTKHRLYLNHGQQLQPDFVLIYSF